jgi:hypothetical protein
MRRLLLVVAVLALAIPATAPAKGSSGGPKNAAKACKAMRTEMGADAFRAAFPSKKGKSSFGRCVSEQRKARRDARKKARKACRAKGLRGKSMNRCVRAELAANPAPKPADYQNGVKECEEDLAEEPEEFAAKYGDGSSAFGRCVSHEAGDDDEGEDEGAEPDDDGSEPDDVDESPADEPAGEL